MVHWRGRGPPSDYKQSASLYKHIETQTDYFKDYDVECHELEEERLGNSFTEVQWSSLFRESPGKKRKMSRVQKGVSKKVSLKKKLA